MWTWGFPGGSDGKESACNARDLGSIRGLGRSPGEGNGNPLQYSCLENPMDRGVWQVISSPWGRKELDKTERLTLSLLCECDRWHFQEEASTTIAWSCHFLYFPHYETNNVPDNSCHFLLVLNDSSISRVDVNPQWINSWAANQPLPSHAHRNFKVAFYCLIL